MTTHGGSYKNCRVDKSYLYPYILHCIIVTQTNKQVKPSQGQRQRREKSNEQSKVLQTN